MGERNDAYWKIWDEICEKLQNKEFQERCIRDGGAFLNNQFVECKEITINDKEVFIISTESPIKIHYEG